MTRVSEGAPWIAKINEPSRPDAPSGQPGRDVRRVWRTTAHDRVRAHVSDQSARVGSSTEDRAASLVGEPKQHPPPKPQAPNPPYPRPRAWVVWASGEPPLP